MKKIISFPHLGDYYIPVSIFLKRTTNLKVVPAPPITKKTIELGTKYSPDSVCLPFKYNLGNFIESLENGANILFTAGGGCRYRYYAFFLILQIAENFFCNKRNKWMKKLQGLNQNSL